MPKISGSSIVIELSIAWLVAGSLKYDLQNDYEMWDYYNELREGIIEAYCSIVQALKSEDPSQNQSEALRPYLQMIVQLLINVSNDKEKTESLTGAACGLLG